MRAHRSHTLRRGRWSEPGRVYHLTLVTRDRLPCFGEWAAASAVASALADPRAWADSRLLCWVLMPDHWHGVLQLGEAETLSRNVGRAKAHASRAWRPADGGKLWQPGFHDRALRAEEDLLAVARYVVANPIRAGLSRGYGAWPYWDAVWIHGDADPAA